MQIAAKILGRCLPAHGRNDPAEQYDHADILAPAEKALRHRLVLQMEDGIQHAPRSGRCICQTDTHPLRAAE